MGEERWKPTGPVAYPEDEWLDLSGIQHFAFCRRQWALIHIEQLWADNTRTTAGQIEHSRVNDYAQSEQRGSVLTIRALRVFSARLGITGICDAVEFRRDPKGVPLRGRSGTWDPYPVEYKHGCAKANDADRLQVCAEAMCLEDMLSCSIPEAALYYRRTNRREVVALNDVIRGTVLKMLAEMRDLYQRRRTPKVRPTKACESCSLKDICLPRLMRPRTTGTAYIQAMIRDD